MPSTASVRGTRLAATALVGLLAAGAATGSASTTAHAAAPRMAQATNCFPTISSVFASSGQTNATGSVNGTINFGAAGNETIGLQSSNATSHALNPALDGTGLASCPTIPGTYSGTSAGGSTYQYIQDFGAPDGMITYTCDIANTAGTQSGPAPISVVLSVNASTGQRTVKLSIALHCMQSADPNVPPTSDFTYSRTLTDPAPTATATPSNTATSTATSTATNTPLPTATSTATNTPVNTATGTPVNTATSTPVPATATSTSSATAVPATATNAPAPSATATPVGPGGGGGAATPELPSGELLAGGILPILGLLYLARRRAGRGE